MGVSWGLGVQLPVAATPLGTELEQESLTQHRVQFPAQEELILPPKGQRHTGPQGPRNLIMGRIRGLLVQSEGGGRGGGLTSGLKEEEPRGSWFQKGEAGGFLV